MRRDFGSELMGLIDRPMNDRVILGIYSACAMAIAKWEPRFAVTGINIGELNEQGVIDLQIRGVYYPEWSQGRFFSDRRRDLHEHHNSKDYVMSRFVAPNLADLGDVPSVVAVDFEEIKAHATNT